MPKPLLIPVALALAGLAVATHSACASAPRQYMDGAPMRPPAPIVVESGYTPPGTGLPEYWGTPEHKPDVQPNPKPTRLLPQTPKSRMEPGIWASDPPRASGEAGPAPEIFDWNVPVPAGDEPVAERVRRCAAIMRAASARELHAHEIQDFDKVTIRWRRCWPHAAVVRCLDGLKQETRTTAERETLQRAVDFARRAVADTCSGGAGMWSPGFIQALERVWGGAR